MSAAARQRPLGHRADVYLAELEQRARGVIGDAAERHERIALAFAGGKGSIACLELLRPYADRLRVIWVNTGATFPHMERFVREAAKGLDLAEIRVDQARHLLESGAPANVVPVESHRVVSRHGVKGQPVSTYAECHRKLIVEPLLEFARGSGETLLVGGYNENDRPALSVDGVELLLPLREWPNAAVQSWLQTRDVALPLQYPELDTSLHCWNCPALLDPARVDFIRRHYPTMIEPLRTLKMATFVLAHHAMEGELATLQALSDVGPPGSDRPAPARRYH